MKTLTPRRAILIGVFLALAISAVWAVFRPWSWAPVDDPGFVLNMRSLVEQHGALAPLVNSVDMMKSDFSWGLFRPAYWLYPGFMYLLPSGLAHGIRLFMLLTIIGLCIIYFHRRGVSGARLWMIVVLLIAAASQLITGLFIVSLQELSGMLFISLGLVCRKQPMRILFWLIAAWFKGPFAWFLIGNAVVQWRRGERKSALASGAIGVISLGISAAFARHGSYTSSYQINVFDPQLWINASRAFQEANFLVILAFAWWLLVTQSQPKWDRDLPIFAIGWLGYFAQLSPWGFTAYYMGPITFSLGLLLCSFLVAQSQVSRKMAVIGITIPLLIAIWLVKDQLSFGLRIDSIMSSATECLSEIPSSRTALFGSVTYVTSSPEGAVRLEQLAQLENSNWQGSVLSAQDSATELLNTDTTHALIVDGSELPVGRGGTETCRVGDVVLYKLATATSPN